MLEGGFGCYFLWHNTMLSNAEALIDSCPSKFRYEMRMISSQPGHPYHWLLGQEGNTILGALCQQNVF